KQPLRANACDLSQGSGGNCSPSERKRRSRLVGCSRGPGGGRTNRDGDLGGSDTHDGNNRGNPMRFCRTWDRGINRKRTMAHHASGAASRIAPSVNVISGSCSRHLAQLRGAALLVVQTGFTVFSEEILEFS